MSTDIKNYNKAMFLRMSTAVAESQPEKIKDFTTLMRCYNGSEHVLSDLTQKGESDNPYEAFANMKIEIAKFTPSYDENGRKVKLGHSDSGRSLYNNKFLLRNENNGLFLTLGYDSLTTLINNFSESREEDIAFIKSYKSKAIAENSSIEDEIAQNFIIETKLRNKSYDSDSDSQVSLLEEKIQSMEALLTMDIDSMEAKSKVMQIMTPRTVLNYLNELGNNVPPYLKRAQEIVSIKDELVDQDDRKRAWFQIYTFVANRKEINTQALLSDFLEDLDYIKSLDENHEIIAKYGKPKMLGIEPIIQQKAITLMDALNVIDRYSFVPARVMQNSKVLNQYNSDLEFLAEEFMSYYCDENGNWARKNLETVPRDVSKTVVSLTSSKEELKNLGKYLFFTKKSNSDLSRSIPIQKLKSMVEGLALTSRKYQYAKNQYGVFKKDLSKSDKEKLKDLLDEQILYESLPEVFGKELDEALRILSNSVYKYVARNIVDSRNLKFISMSKIQSALEVDESGNEKKTKLIRLVSKDMKASNNNSSSDNSSLTYQQKFEKFKQDLPELRIDDILGYNLHEFLSSSQIETIDGLEKLIEIRKLFSNPRTKHIVTSRNIMTSIKGMHYYFNVPKDFRAMLISEAKLKFGNAWREHALVSQGKNVEYQVLPFNNKVRLSSLYFVLSAFDKDSDYLKGISKVNKSFLDFINARYYDLTNSSLFSNNNQATWFANSSNSAMFKPSLKIAVDERNHVYGEFAPLNNKHQWIEKEACAFEFDAKRNQWNYQDIFTKLELAKLLKSVVNYNAKNKKKLKVFFKTVSKN